MPRTFEKNRGREIVTAMEWRDTERFPTRSISQATLFDRTILFHIYIYIYPLYDLLNDDTFPYRKMLEFLKSYHSKYCKCHRKMNAPRNTNFPIICRFCVAHRCTRQSFEVQTVTHLMRLCVTNYYRGKIEYLSAARRSSMLAGS